jgi:hypothetical protein
MSQANSRLLQAQEQLKAAVAEITAAHEAIPDEDFTKDIPSVLVCIYDPVLNQGHFTLLGNVTHAAGALEEVLNDPEHYPFKMSLLDAMQDRLLSQC